MKKYIAFVIILTLFSCATYPVSYKKDKVKHYTLKPFYNVKRKK